MLIPLGLEKGAVHRVPWVCIGLAVASIGVYVYTDYVAAGGSTAEEREIEELLSYWAEHPYLVPSEGFRTRFLPLEIQEAARDLRQMAIQQKRVPVSYVLEVEQQRFDRMCQNLLDLRARSPVDRWALVPARGWAQRGFLGHIFLHGGWWHLIGNLFFLYLVGPFLEDIWGRPFFAGFYLVGGMVAGACQLALNPSSPVPVIGASGAIAACMGAFAVRFATRRMQMLFWVGVFAGTFTMPAAVWAGLWVLNEIVSFRLQGAGAQVAFMAHIGGFGFGMVVGVCLKLMRFETLFIAPGLEKKQGVWRQHPLVAQAEQAAQEGRLDAARAAFREVLDAEPAHIDAAWGMARLLWSNGDTAGITGVLHAPVDAAVSKGDWGVVAAVLKEFADAIDPSVWRPPVAFRVGDALAASNPELAEKCFVSAARAEGTLATKALTRAADLNLTQLGRPGPAVVLAERGLQLGPTGELRAQIEAIRERAAMLPAAGPSGAFPSDDGLELDLAPSVSAAEPDRTEPAPPVVAGPATEEPSLAIHVSPPPPLPDRAPGLALTSGSTAEVEPSAATSDAPIELSLPTGAAPPSTATSDAPIEPLLPTGAAPPSTATSDAPIEPLLPSDTAPAAAKRAIVGAQFTGRAQPGYAVRLDNGRAVEVAPHLIRSVAVGMIRASTNVETGTMVLDLLLPARRGVGRVLRFSGPDMGLAFLFGSAAADDEAIHHLLEELMAHAKVQPPTTAAELARHQIPRFSDLDSFDRFYYGPTS